MIVFRQPDGQSPERSSVASGTCRLRPAPRKADSRLNAASISGQLVHKSPQKNPANRCILSDTIQDQELEGDEDFGQGAEPLMDVFTKIITHPQPAVLMKPTDRSLHDPAVHTQATAVRRPTLGQLRVDPAVAQLL